MQGMNITLTVNTSEGWKSNLFGSFFIDLPSGAITPKYFVYPNKNEEKDSKTLAEGWT